MVNIKENRDSLGLRFDEILKNKRLELKLRLEDVAFALNVKVKDIQAIESNDIEFISTKSYAAGLIFSYAKLLKINRAEIEKEIKSLPLKSNLSKKYKLINVAEESPATPTRENTLNFLLISILLFLILLVFYHFYEKGSDIKNDSLIIELENAEIREKIEL